MHCSTPAKTSSYSFVRWIALFALALVCNSGRLAAQGSRDSSGHSAERDAQVAVLSLPADAVTKGTVLLRDGRRLPYMAQAGILAVGGTDAQDLEVSAPEKLTGVVHIPEGSAIAAMSYVASFAEDVPCLPACWRRTASI